MEGFMQYENKNIIFTIFNKNFIYTLVVFEIISLIAVILFFTVIRPEYIVLGLPFVFFVFVLPIFMYGMRNKIIYRFTEDELQCREKKQHENIKWVDIKSYEVDNENIILSLKDNSKITLPVLNFNIDDLKKALALHIK